MPTAISKFYAATDMYPNFPIVLEPMAVACVLHIISSENSLDILSRVEPELHLSVAKEICEPEYSPELLDLFWSNFVVWVEAHIATLADALVFILCEVLNYVAPIAVLIRLLRCVLHRAEQMSINRSSHSVACVCDRVLHLREEKLAYEFACRYIETEQNLAAVDIFAGCFRRESKVNLPKGRVKRGATIPSLASYAIGFIQRSAPAQRERLIQDAYEQTPSDLHDIVDSRLLYWHRSRQIRFLGWRKTGMFAGDLGLLLSERTVEELDNSLLLERVRKSWAYPFSSPAPALLAVLRRPERLGPRETAIKFFEIVGGLVDYCLRACLAFDEYEREIFVPFLAKAASTRPLWEAVSAAKLLKLFNAMEELESIRGVFAPHKLDDKTTREVNQIYS